ncbi:hypothetical protein [Azospirillum endophyticum]
MTTYNFPNNPAEAPNCSSLFACPSCESVLEFDGPIYVDESDPLNDVRICRNCGIIFKPAVSFNGSVNSDRVYSKRSWDFERATHSARMLNIVSMTKKHFTISESTSILVFAHPAGGS